MIPKSIQLDSLLNERLRRYAFESRTKEAQIIRDALHAWLAQQVFEARMPKNKRGQCGHTDPQPPAETGTGQGVAP